MLIDRYERERDVTFKWRIACEMVKSRISRQKERERRERKEKKKT